MRILNSVMAVVVVIFLLSVSASSYAVPSVPRGSYSGFSAEQAEQQESIGKVAIQYFPIQSEALLSTLENICAKKNMNKFCKQNLVTITLSDREGQMDLFINYLCPSCVLVKN